MSVFKMKKGFFNYKNPNPIIFPYHAPSKISGLILDFSGTTLDAHVIAPAFSFMEAFAKEGVPISMEEARKPMGLRKDLHILKILEDPQVIERWTKIKGSPPSFIDGARLFRFFIPIQNACLKEYSKLIPGTNEAVSYARENLKMKIGLTTGFTREMVNILLAEAKPQGFVPDVTVAGDDIQNNMGFRPAPFMVFRNMELMGLYDRRTIVKVDDTVGGVGEGLNAGVWTIALYKYSNYTNVDTIDQWEKMNLREKEERWELSKKILVKSGAHYVVDSIKELPMILDDINERVKRGESP